MSYAKLNFGELTEIYLCLHSAWKKERKAFARALNAEDKTAQHYSAMRLNRLFNAMSKIMRTIERDYEDV